MTILQTSLSCAGSARREPETMGAALAVAATLAVGLGACGQADGPQGLAAGAVREGVAATVAAPRPRVTADGPLPLASPAAHSAAPPGTDPPMGWSSWSFVRGAPTEAKIRAQAQAMHDALAGHGYLYVNIDDYYYLDPSRTVDAYGRWVVDAPKFPGGMAALGAYVHSLGLKFGLYVTPGVPVAAVHENTPIEGTPYHAADIATWKQENNYNFKGSMLYIDFDKPGAQAFIDSWARLFASYGVDFLKLDGVGSFDIPDVRAWSAAIAKTGRPIHLELSNKLSLGDADTWAALANGWRIEDDIECYCSLASFPLTKWENVAVRFDDLALWQPHSRAHARNDPDSLEVGNGEGSGLTADERRTQMTLWAISAAPLLLGADLTQLDRGDLALLTNDEVIAVDQAGVAARRVVGGDRQVWAAPQPDGSVVVALFNLGGAPAKVSFALEDVGITGSRRLRDLWARKDAGSVSGAYETTAPAHGAVLLRSAP